MDVSQLELNQLFQFTGFAPSHFYNDEVYQLVSAPDWSKYPDGTTLESVADLYRVRRVYHKVDGKWTPILNPRNESVNYNCPVTTVDVVICINPQ